MKGLVLDASAMLSWLAPSQATAATEALLDQLEAFELRAPFVFDFEVRNGLLGLERRALLPSDLYQRAVLLLAEYGVRLEPAPAVEGNVALAKLARRERISLFDAFYLALADDEGLPLASRDGGLLSAARRHGVDVHDLRDEPRP